MGRIRSIKPEFPQSESMGNVSRDARLLFIQLWTLVDDSGRARGSSRMLASLLFPYDDDAPGLIGAWLGELQREGCVELYEVDGARYVWCKNFLRHQKIDKATASKLPEYTEASRVLAESSRVVDDGSGSGSGSGSGLDLEMEGDCVEVEEICATPALQATAVMLIPLNDGSEFGMHQGQVDEFSRLYPAVDVMAELRKMRGWAIANPRKRKTRSGIMRFVNAWLAKAQDSPNKSRTAPLNHPTNGGSMPPMGL